MTRDRRMLALPSGSAATTSGPTGTDGNGSIRFARRGPRRRGRRQDPLASELPSHSECAVRLLPVLLCCMLAMAVAVTTVRASGDGGEYLLSARALLEHGTPDIREAD